MNRNKWLFLLVTLSLLLSAPFGGGVTNVRAQESEPPDWLMPLITACAANNPGACEAVTAYYNAQSGVQQPDKPGLGEGLFDVAGNGDPLNCTNATRPQKFLGNVDAVGPFDWVQQTRFGDEYNEVMTLVEFTKPNHVLAFTEGSYQTNYAVGADEHLVGQTMQFKDTSENVMCAAEAYAKDNGITSLIYTGSLDVPPAGWTNFSDATLVDHVFKTDKYPSEIKGAVWTDPPIFLEMGKHTFAAQHSGYINAQIHNNIDADSNGNTDDVWHLYVEPNCSVEVTQDMQGTVFEVYPESAGTILSLDEVLTRFGEMSDVIRVGDHPDELHILYLGLIAPPAGSGFTPDKLPDFMKSTCTVSAP